MDRSKIISLGLKRPISMRLFNFSTILCALVENQLFAPWETLFLFFFCRLLIFFQKRLFSKVSNSLDPDQAPHSVMPDLGLNCLQKLSKDDTRR